MCSKSIEHSYWGEIPKSLMIDLLDDCREHGWIQALENRIMGRFPTIYKYITSEDRADWAFWVPLNKESKVLDLGSGWGSLAFILADKCKYVLAIESVKERVEFINIRKEQEDFKNVDVIQADALRPPVISNTFDLIISNGLLEWVPLGDLENHPEDVQKAFLSRTKELLNPGGTLYIGIENRLGMNFLLGAKDHTGLPFTSIMPRFLASLILQIRKPTKAFSEKSYSGYRTYTYHAGKYRKIMEECGFRDVQIFWAMPSYNHPSAMGNINNPNTIKHYFSAINNPKSKAGKVLKILIDLLSVENIAIHFPPSYVIFAKV